MNCFTHLLAISPGSECMSTICKTAEQYCCNDHIIMVSRTSAALEFLASFEASNPNMPIVIFLDTSSNYNEGLEMVTKLDETYGDKLKNKVVLVNTNLSINRTMRLAVTQCVNNFMTCPLFDYEVETLLNSLQPSLEVAV